MNLKAKIVAVLMALAPVVTTAQEAKLNLIPLPQKIQENNGVFVIDNNVSICGNATFEIEYLKEKISKSSGIKIQKGQNGTKKIEINITPSAQTKEEGYELNVTHL